MDQKEDKKDSTGSDFIKEVVKDKNPRKNTFFYRLLCVVILAAAGGAVAALVFALALPAFRNLTGSENEPVSKISIPEDEQTGMQSSSASSSAEQTASSEISGTDTGSDVKSDSKTGDGTDTTVSGSSITPAPSQETQKPETTETPETPETSETSEKEKKPDNDAEQETPVLPGSVFELDDMKKINQDLYEISLPAQKSIVKVTGITNQLDYFNQTYENAQQTSGLIIADGDDALYILTDYSILENVERIQVELDGGYLVDAVFQKNDPETGLAVIKADISDIPEETRSRINAAPLGNSLNVSQGTPVIALGSPMGYSDYISYGMITSVSNRLYVYDGAYTVFTTNIPGRNDGNGVILNLDGEVIGVMIRGSNDVSESTINTYSLSQIKSLLEKLSNNESRPFVGIKGVDVTGQISERTGIPKGVLVTEVQADSPAMIAGLTENDVIVSLAGEEITTLNSFSTVLKKWAPEDKIVIKAMRKGAEGYKEIEFKLELGEI